MLYGSDGTWWKLRNGVPEFKGLKLSQDSTACRDYDVHHISMREMCDQILVDEPGIIGSGSKNGGGNSGFHALNIAVQFGARKIVLVGFDMRLDRGMHWHGKHPRGLNNPRDTNLMPWRLALNGAAETLSRLSVEVINASEVSTLTAYPIMSLQQALN